MTTEILGIIITSVTEIAKLFVVPLRNHVRYFAKHHSIVEDLQRQVEELRMIRDCSKSATNEARRRGEAINGLMEEWLRKADITVSDAWKLVGNDSSLTEKGRRGNSKTCCKNLGTRYMVSKRAVKLLKVINKLSSSRGHITVSQPAPPPSIEVMPTGDFEAFESTRAAMSKVIEALIDDDNKLIGVYGMGGVGKTSLVREVARYTKIRNMFDEIVIATVSQNPDLKKIQSEIAEGLGLRLEETTEYMRSLRLAERLTKQEGRIFIILDDVWERVELSQIGIPSPKDKSNCKIVITTRNLHVCSEMYCNISIEVEVLSEQDSWDLFKKVASDNVESPEVNDIAKAVARECGGLPIALVTLGRVLRNKDQHMWEDAAYELRESRPTNIKGMHEKVFSCLKLSFDQVQNEESQLCYLHCSLFPEDSDVQIEDLLRYGIGEGLFSDVETVDEARTRVRSLISNFKASCLLLSSKKEGCVKMHDVFRDLAISIATHNDYSFMVKASSGLLEWPVKLKLEFVMRMSLINNEFSTFGAPRECPELVLLLLQNNRTLKAISDDFFAGMRALLVLDLSNIPNLIDLPLSLSCLTNLRTLCVENNNLKDGSALGGLSSLEILSLRKTSFANFPEEIRRLTNLRLLDLTDAQVGAVPAQVISSLCHLDELYMGGSFDGWIVKETEVEGRASLIEVFSLERLNIVHIDIRDYNCLTEEIISRCTRLKKFHICIGDRFRWQTTYNRSIYFNIPDEFRVPKPFVNWVKIFLQRTSELSIGRWRNLSSLEQLHSCDFQFMKHLHLEQCDIQACFSVSLFEEFKDLQELQIFSCSKMHTVFPEPPNNVFPRLKRINIRDAPMLTALWQGVAPSVGLQSLQHLTIESCAQIKTLFPSALVGALNQLQYLEIFNCESLKAVISNGAHENEDTPLRQSVSSYTGPLPRTLQTHALFPQLQTLKLMYLKNIICISQPRCHLDFPSLEYVTVLSCPRLTKLPFGPKNFHKLVEVKAERKWLDKLEFEDENTKVSLQKCFIETRA